MIHRSTNLSCNHDFAILLQGQTYALTQLPASKKVVDDLYQVVYSEIQPKTQGEATSTVPDHTAEQACETGIANNSFW